MLTNYTFFNVLWMVFVGETKLVVGRGESDFTSNNVDESHYGKVTLIFLSNAIIAIVRFRILSAARCSDTPAPNSSTL